MKSMRWRIALSALWLSLLFNIERLDLDQQAAVNLSSAFYLMAVVSAALFLLLPLRRQYMSIVGTGILIVYTILKVISPIPVFQSFHKYITLTEIVSLIITMGLVWLVNEGLQDFEHAVEAISLPKGRAGMLEYDQIHERIRTEMGRARRHQHPISVAAIELDPVTSEAALHRAVRDAQAALIKRYVQVQFGVFMSKHIRETDVIAHHDGDGYFLLVAPETPADQTAGMLTRLAHQVEEHLGIRFRYSIADFPKMALTSEELLHKATDELSRETKTSIDRHTQREPAVATGSADT
jgi:GGDEF domain-containing protein